MARGLLDLLSLLDLGSCLLPDLLGGLLSLPSSCYLDFVCVAFVAGCPCGDSCVSQAPCFVVFCDVHRAEIWFGSVKRLGFLVGNFILCCRVIL